MRLENFKAKDYYRIDQKEGLEVWLVPEDIPNALLFLEKEGVSRSVWFGDELYAIFGMVEIRYGVVEVFFMSSKGWEEKKKTICALIKKDLIALTKIFNRVQMTCLEEETFLRFSHFFGFTKERSLKRYDRFGRTYSMLAINGGTV